MVEQMDFYSVALWVVWSAALSAAKSECGKADKSAALRVGRWVASKAADWECSSVSGKVDEWELN